MIPCNFQYDSPSDKACGYHKYVCKRCGVECHSPYEAGRQRGDCKEWPTAGEPGYMLVLLLAAIGITQQRYIWTKRQFGLAPVCGCGQRAEALNTIGSRFANGLKALWKFLTRKQA